MLTQGQLSLLDEMDSHDLAEYVYDDRENTLAELAEQYTDNDLVELLFNNIKATRNKSVAFSINELKKKVCEMIDNEYYNIKRY